MDSGKLLWVTSVSHQKREKRIKSSDDAATNGDPGASLSEVTWPGTTK